ncbi:MAG: VCBS repeat-containing protein [Armatimonadetes bacterium]|nr:VCBS repeat-containing protein [Armatimonadota bacterium]
MRHLMVAAVLVAAMVSTPGTWSEEFAPMENVQITRLKKMYRETALVAGGQAQCAIVAPADPAYLPLAQKLAGAVEKAYGAAPPVRQAGEMSGRLPPSENLIALGVFANNKVVDDLYLREFVLCDYSWPGAGNSFEIRTVHNPWLNGKNVLYLGSASLAGCQAAVDRFIQILAEHPGGSIGPIIEVVKDGERAAPPSDEEVATIQRGIDAATHQDGPNNDAALCATNYFVTGQPVWAKLFLQAMRKADELRRTQPAVELPPNCQYLFHWFDCIEEGSAFSDAERLELTNILYRAATRMREARSVQKPLTISAGNWRLTGAFAALYLSRSYPDLALSKLLLSNLDTFYAPDMVHWKPPEDCPSYGQHTIARSFRWALHRPSPAYIENGLLKKAADYYMLISNNLGQTSGFGDFTGLGDKPHLVATYPLAAWLYKDGRYLWWWDHFSTDPTASGSGSSAYQRKGLLGWVPPEVLPRKRPDDLLGVAVAPLDPWIYERRNVAEFLGVSYEESHRFPLEECYDKVAFRAGFEPEDQYLCMSGFSWGYHSHPDVNAIVNYTDQRKTMLYDDGYMVAWPSEHNTVVILKDGWMGGVPELAQVRSQADLPGIGVFVSRVNDYSGVDWDRCVIWSKARYFLVIDDVQAKDPASYSLQCIWRTLGSAELQGRRWVSENPPGRFHLIACSDAGLTEKASAGMNLNAPALPLDKARRLIQSADVRLEPGQGYQFANLFYSTPDEAGARRVEVSRVGDTTTYLVEDEGKAALAGIRESDVVPGLSIEGAAFHLLSDTLTVAGARRVAAGGPLFSADAPVNVQANLRTGEAIVQVKKAAQITFAAAQGEKRERLEPGTHSLKLRPVSPAALEGIAREVQATRARLAAAPTAAEKPGAGSGQGLRKLWEYRAAAAAGEQAVAGSGSRPNVVRVADANGDGRHEVFVAGTDNAIHALAPDGRRLWRHPLPAIINDMNLAEGPGDQLQILAGCGNNTDISFEVDPSHGTAAVHSLKADGTANWRVVPPPRSYGRPGYREGDPVLHQGTPVAVFADDLNGDGSPEIIVLAHTGWVYAYDHAGKPLWERISHSPHSMTTGTAFDLDGDGRKEIIVNNVYGYSQILSSEGEVLGTAGGTAHAGGVAAAAADVDGDGQGEVVVGDKLGKVWLQKTVKGAKWSAREETNVYNAGGDITAVAMGDVNGDGKLETAVASKNFLLYLFDAERQPLWHVNLGDTCLDIRMADVTGDGRADIVCGCEDGTVKVVDGGGKVIAWYQAGSAVRAVCVCELDGKAETKEIVASCADGTVCALQVAR